MSKVQGKAKLFKDPQRGWVLVPVDLENVKKQCIDKWIKRNTVSIVLDMIFQRPKEEKTLSQLGYLHAAVWPVFYAYYQTQGEIIEDEPARERVRDDVKWAIGFTQTQLNKFHGPNTTKVKSFATATKDETTEAIDAIIRLAADYGMVVPSPEEYLQKHGATQFEDDNNK